MNYQETVDYLFTKLPLYSRTGSVAYKEDITNTVELCQLVGNPHKNFKSIHIAGTNGKGSTSHMLAAILQQAGYRTGLYTSPHLKDFRERIRINGEMIKKEFVVEFIDRIKAESERIEPSFFELTVAMAFKYFSDENVDIAVIETGLGGRLDSTNILDPILSVITNIGYDHQNILGDTLEQIATEKAGIIKDKTPVVIGETTLVTKPIFIDTAEKKNAEIIFSEQQYGVISFEQTAFLLYLVIQNQETKQSLKIEADLNGNYQLKNICTVLTAVDVIKRAGYLIHDADLLLALKNVKGSTGLHGRWDVISKKPMIVLDVAHNEDGIKQLLKQLDLIKFEKLHIVFGLVKDKDATKILSLLPASAQYYFTNADIPRALPAEELQEKAKNFNLTGSAFLSVKKAFNAAKKSAAVNDLVLVCGSIFVVAEID